MPQAIISYEYNRAALNALAADLKSKATISEDGKLITVGESTAKRVGFSTRIFGGDTGWEFSVPGQKLSKELLPLIIPGTDLVRAQKIVTDRLAELEAERTLPQDEKDAALVAALQDRLAQVGEPVDYSAP